MGEGDEDAGGGVEEEGVEVEVVAAVPCLIMCPPSSPPAAQFYTRILAPRLSVVSMSANMKIGKLKMSKFQNFFPTYMYTHRENY